LYNDFKKHLAYLIQNQFFWIFILILFTILSRLLILDGRWEGYSWDAGNFVLAADSYRLEEAKPHLPGYYLYVESIKILSLITGNHFKSMILLSVTYSALAALFLYLIVSKWYTNKESFAITLMILTNPLSWYFGAVSEIYAFDLFFSAAIAYPILSTRLVLLTPALMAIGCGIRPSSAVLLLPLYVYFWCQYFRKKTVSVKTIIISHMVAVVFLLLWLIPLISSAGGLHNYLQLYHMYNPIENIMHFWYIPNCTKSM